MDNTFGIAATPVAQLAASLSHQRDFAIFGALAGLLIVNGIAPTPLDPVLLHYFVHDCDFNSITPAILSEWHQQFYSTIQRWQDLGHDGDVSSFGFWLATYADNTDVSRNILHGLSAQCSDLCRQPAAIQHRDSELHLAFAAFMVYRAIVGTEAPSHSDIRSFLSGFRLPTRNGFSLPIVCAYSTIVSVT